MIIHNFLHWSHPKTFLICLHYSLCFCCCYWPYQIISSDWYLSSLTYTSTSLSLLLNLFTEF
jgi:hypothetical protein